MDRKLGHCRKKYLLGESGKTQISRYLGKTKSMQVLLGRGLTTKGVNVLVTACVRRGICIWRLGQVGWRRKIASSWKDALVLNPATPHAAVQWHLPTVSLVIYKQAFSAMFPLAA